MKPCEKLVDACRSRDGHLGNTTAHAERDLASGRFASTGEAVRAGLRALDREEAALDDLIRARVDEALADPRPFSTLEEGFAAVRAVLADRP